LSSTVDTNVLIYASNASDPLHGPAESLVKRLAAGPELLYLFWPVLLGYVRIVTHAGILPRPLTPREAIANVESLLDRAHVRAPGEADGFWRLYRSAGDQARGNEVPDAHLVSLMRQNGVRVIYTPDRGFRRFDGVDPRDPFASAVSSSTLGPPRSPSRRDRVR
jgi:toxin-antitoxin system PIN domain toxin